MSAFITARSATRKMRVLMAGSRGFLGSNLTHHLETNGFEVYPLLRQMDGPMSGRGAFTFDDITTTGLPDVDYVINVSGSNIFEKGWDEMTKNEIETSRVSINRLISDAIRMSGHKPYAFIHASSANYYPPSHNMIYDESFTLPLQPTDISDPAVHARELSLPYWSRLTRAWERRALVHHEGEVEMTRAALLEQKQATTLEVFDNQKFPPLPNPRTSPKDTLSDRHMMLLNSDVRVVHVRMGALTSYNSPISKALGWYSDWGLLNRIEDGSQYFPWVHIDDACAMFLSAMVSETINGPVNCVAPELTTNAEYFKGLRRMRKSFVLPFSISEKEVYNRAGIVKGSLLTESLMVKPQKATVAGFKFQYPSIDEASEAVFSRLDLALQEE